MSSLKIDGDIWAIVIGNTVLLICLAFFILRLELPKVAFRKLFAKERRSSPASTLGPHEVSFDRTVDSPEKRLFDISAVDLPPVTETTMAPALRNEVLSPDNTAESDDADIPYVVFGTDGESPLAKLGYTVRQTESRFWQRRRRILKKAISQKLKDVRPESYQEFWGRAGSAMRVQRVADHIVRLIRQRNPQERMQDAVTRWQSDVNWLKREYGARYPRVRWDRFE